MMLAKFFEGVRLAIVESGYGREVAAVAKEVMGGPVSCTSAPRCFHLELENRPHARCPGCALSMDPKPGSCHPWVRYP